MRVILSTELKDIFTQFVVVDTFKKIRDLKGVTTLIIHKYNENDFEAGVFISEFRSNGVSQFVYINANPSTTIKMALSGINGRVYEDEFYLEDEEELCSLLDEIDETEDSSEETSLAQSSINIVNDFVQSFVRGEERVHTPIYLERVSQAVTELAVINEQQENQIVAMGNSAIEVFERASNIIHKMDDQRRKIEKQLEELELSQNNAGSGKVTFSNSITFFTPVKYLGNSKVLLIREYAPTRYLTSFVLGYLHHLHYELNRRPKLIFAHQKGQGISSKYSDFPAITQESMNIASLYDSEIVATNNPKKEVMNELLMKHNDVIVVVDRLYGSTDIVSGRITKVSAVSSRSDIERYKVKPEETIFSVTAQPKQLFCIPTIKNFPIESDARYAQYSQIMGDKYIILDNKLNLKAGEL